MEKNLFFLIRVFDLVLKQMPDVKLLIVGDGPIKQELINMVKYLGIAEKVIFTGYVTHDKVFYFLELSQLLLFPSKTETQGLIVLEAFCFGTPALCLNQMGVQDILVDEKGGFLLEENEELFAEAVIELASNEVLYEQKVMEAKEVAAANHSKTMAIETCAVYESLLKK